ncbi:hypothetical protein M3G15_08625 [Paenibacillus sp. p3-SID1389]|uniref:hypothetical protein n=1 Tax=Paenibacillus sp. p3-SID1389 TaxID=2916364 RepID=UPI0021A95956|nr:hypothetical protein [Paenibacillus sp. p3-SID1389]MCT2195204.1 hypothetical protein [Paenibacillus sp. p3-SID1389]
MKVRQLLECTVDLAQPLPELSAVVSAVLAALPDVEQRAEILRQLDDQITEALLALDNADEEAAA